MTFADKSNELARQVIQIVEMSMDFCDNTYGSAPCTATFSGGSPTGTEECFNTWQTCQDRPNYVKTERILRFSTYNVQPPTNLECLPFLKSMSTIPTQLDVGRSIGTQATRNIQMDSPPYHDDVFDLDPYVTIRAVPSAQASFFAKFVARKKYLEGRVVRVLTGFLNDDGTFDAANFRTTTYTIKKFSINKDGMFTLQVGSILRQADSNKLKFPLPSSKKLLTELTAPATSIEVSGKPEHYLDYLGTPITMVGNFVRIGEEIMQVTSVVGDTTINYDGKPSMDAAFEVNEVVTFGNGSTARINSVVETDPNSGTIVVQMITGPVPINNNSILGANNNTNADVNGTPITAGANDTDDVNAPVVYNVTRPVANTTNAEASIGDTVQHVYRAQNKTVRDAFYDVVRAARIDASFIDYDGQWLDEQTQWLIGYNVNTWRAHPEDIKKVLNNLIKNTPAFVFYDERAQTVKLLALKQGVAAEDIAYEVNDAETVVDGSDSYKLNDEDRISRVAILYDKFDQAKEDDEQANYRQWEVDIDFDAEDDNAYGSSNVNEMTVFGTWITSESIANLLGQRMLADYNEPPLHFTFKTDVKDSEIFVGDYIRVTSRRVIDEKGNPRTFFAQVIKVNEVVAGHQYEYTAQELVNGALAKVWGPDDGSVEADATLASEAEKEKYMYWGDASGQINGGTEEGFKWV